MAKNSRQVYQNELNNNLPLLFPQAMLDLCKGSCESAKLYLKNIIINYVFLNYDNQICNSSILVYDDRKTPMDMNLRRRKYEFTT